MNLFELNQNYAQLEEREDLDEKVLKGTLDSLADARDVKCDNIARWIEKLKSDEAFLSDKKADITKALTATKNKRKWLSDYLTSALDQAGLKELKTKNYIMRPRSYKASVVIDDLEALPDELKTTKIEITADKKRIYEVLKDSTLKGAHLQENRGTVIK